MAQSSSSRSRNEPPARGLPLEPRQAGRLILGDNLAVLGGMPSDAFQLIYADPPFATGRRRGRGGASFPDFRAEPRAYLEWLMPRLAEMRRVLDPRGTLYVHLDWHAVHYVKVGLDEIFGRENFRNEIIWHYNSGPRRQRDFGRRHDVILRYSKTANYFFDPDAVRQPYSPDINIPPSKRHYYHPRGKVMDDVWRIPIIPQNDKRERLGYPTQKPEALLEVIVRSSSRPGDLVGDFFCGSGTTLAVAARLGRRWVGCDDNPEAIALARRRLAAILPEEHFTVERSSDCQSVPTSSS